MHTYAKPLARALSDAGCALQPPMLHLHTISGGQVSAAQGGE